MKVYRKKIRKITVEGHPFYYVVDENYAAENVKIRIYSAKCKSTIFSVSFTWGDSWHMNLYKPSVCAALIKYALANGWNPEAEKQVMTIPQGSFLIEKLGLSV